MIKNRDILVNNIGDNRVKKAREDIAEAIEFVLDKIDSKESVFNNINLIKTAIEKNNAENVYLIALGKASLPMTEAALQEIDVTDGVAITNGQCKNLEINCIQSSHPIPSDKSIKAAEYVIKILKKASKNDLIIFLISGGGSAMVELPYIDLEDLKQTTDVLIKHSLSINEINCIRKHLSAIKGGKAIKYTDAHIIALIVSDVAGNDLSSIASGLTYYDKTTFEDALEIIKRNGLEGRLPEATIEFLMKKNREYETLKKDEFPFERVENIIIADNETALSYAKEFFLSRYNRIYVKEKVVGNIEKAARFIAEFIKKADKEKIKPIISVFGGEVSVDVKGAGIGGRNQHLALLLSDKLKGIDFVCASLATDSKDGNSDAAGAFFDKYTPKRAGKLGLNMKKYINGFDSYTFFNKLNDCIFINDTKTNVADLLFCIVF